MDRLGIFANYANDAKTPKDLLKAIKKLGPLPRYHEKCIPVPPRIIHLGASGTASNPRYAEIIELVRKGKGKIVEEPNGRLTYCWGETAPALEEANAVYAHARQIAIRLRELNPDLPPLPGTETDPFLGVQSMQEWCISRSWTKAMFGWVAAVVCSGVTICVLLALVYWLPCKWVKNHPDSYALQGAAYIITTSSWFAIFQRGLRRYWWVSVLLAFGAVLVGRLGGPPAK